MDGRAYLARMLRCCWISFHLRGIFEYWKGRTQLHLVNTTRSGQGKSRPRVHRFFGGGDRAMRLRKYRPSGGPYILRIICSGCKMPRASGRLQVKVRKNSMICRESPGLPSGVMQQPPRDLPGIHDLLWIMKGRGVRCASTVWFSRNQPTECRSAANVAHCTAWQNQRICPVANIQRRYCVRRSLARGRGFRIPSIFRNGDRC